MDSIGRGALFDCLDHNRAEFSLSGMLCSFGSFFGPSEPIVAKRIIDEAAAREVTVMVAARAAKQAQVCPPILTMLHVCACVCVHTTHELGPSPKSHVLCASLLSDICAAVWFV
jgi:hypothetical protein